MKINTQKRSPTYSMRYHKKFTGSNKRKGPNLLTGTLLQKNGGYLLSHLRSTIGVSGLNFSVRNGKRWNPAAIGHLELRMTYPTSEKSISYNDTTAENTFSQRKSRAISSARL